MIHHQKNQPNEKRLPNMTIDTSKPYQHKQIDTRWVQLKVNHKLPPRAYFGSCIQAGKVFIHGGYNEEKGILSDMYEAQFYSLPTEWIQIKAKNKKNKGPPALRNHTLCAYTAYLILLGGQKNMLQNNNEIYRYDMRTNQWDILKSTFEQSSSKVNLSLDSHIAHIYNDYMYVFGGYQSQKGLYFNHLLQINLKNVAKGELQIKQIQTDIKPSPRGNMSSTIIDNQMFIFGGTNSDSIFDDLWLFNFEKLEWKQIAKPSKEQSLEWPQKRKGQTMSAHAKSRAIFMFGGIKQITKQQNDIMVFLVSKMKWVRIHKNTNQLYEPSPTIKKQIETSPSIIDARDRKLNSNSKSKSKTKTQPKSPFKLGIKSVTCYNKSMTQATQIEGNFNNTYKPLKTQIVLLLPTQKKRIMSIMQQKKNRQFLLRKKKLLSAINQSPQPLGHRPYSPTSQSLQYSLHAIGQQKMSSPKQQDNLPKVIFDPEIGQVIGKKPCARDGHAGLVFQDGILIVGGDRHMMAFGDVFRFRMDKAIQNIHLYQ